MFAPGYHGFDFSIQECVESMILLILLILRKDRTGRIETPAL
jgi:hypothetical protein